MEEIKQLNYTETLHLKLSKEDKQIIRNKAKAKRMTMNSYIRNELLNN
jgi:hypothetical protein